LPIVSYMRFSRLWISFILLTAFLQGCSLLGYYKSIPNPEEPNKPPKFDKETIMLGELTPMRSCYDVSYYDLDIEIKPKKKYISGTVTIQATALSDFDMFQIDLDQNLDISSLKDVQSNEDLYYTRDQRGVFIVRNTNVKEQFSVEIKYSGKPIIAKKPPWKGGMVWKKDDNKLPWAGVMCESEGASIWWPCKDHTSDEPDSMDIHITVPSEVMAVSNGTLQGADNQDIQTTYHWKVTQPINTYNVTFYLGDFEQFRKTYIGNNGDTLNLGYYVFDKNFEKAKEHFNQVDEVIEIFEEKIGEFPWYEDGYKLIESPYEGMEHQSAIAYGNGFKNDLYEAYDYIIVHETAHEWWGNAITVADLSDVWIQEGFATYSEYIFLENTDCENCADNLLNFYQHTINNKYPVVSFPDRRWFHFRKSSDVYVKGAWILHTLRQQVGDAMFFDIIQSFYKQYKYQIVTSQDFINMVNGKTGKDYNWFFEQYLYHYQVPELHFFIFNGGMKYHWEKTLKSFDQLAIKLDFGNQVITIKPSQDKQELLFPAGSTSMKIDHNILMKTVREDE
jgi:aminopeptidase N